jgi:hypothetical protein
MLGIFFNSYFDFSFNLFGVAIGLTATTVTSLYQVVNPTKTLNLYNL